jgi:HEAT repeat protein
MEEVLKTVQTYFEAIEKYEKGDRSALNQVGGIEAFKDKLSGWLSDDDQSIRAFAAVLLGIMRDKTYAPRLATLLKQRELTDAHLHYDTGRAAMALGLLGAKEYTPNLVDLLNSSNGFDRAGAAYGLGWLGAKDQAAAVARLLNDKDENVRLAAIESLEMMGATDLIKDKKQERRKR